MPIIQKKPWGLKKRGRMTNGYLQSGAATRMGNEYNGFGKK